MYEDEINQRLKSEKNYLGSFAINEEENLKINTYPSFMVVNLDERKDRYSLDISGHVSQ